MVLSPLLASRARAQDIGGNREADLRVWLDPKFMRAPVAGPFAGARKTELVAGFLTLRELAPCSPGTLESLKLTWEQLAARGRANAAAELADLKPRYERNSKNVITYAALESDRPIVSCAVLAPKFLELFKDTLGEKVLVVVPSRFSAFIFPRLASEHLQFSPMIFRAFRATAWPVSVELFEVSAEAGWRCIGAYEEP